MKPNCPECGRNDEVVKAFYNTALGKDYYWECERCYLVVKRISKFKLPFS